VAPAPTPDLVVETLTPRVVRALQLLARTPMRLVALALADGPLTVGGVADRIGSADGNASIGLKAWVNEGFVIREERPTGSGDSGTGRAGIPHRLNPEFWAVDDKVVCFLADGFSAELPRGPFGGGWLAGQKRA
jgi:hypothetical protein